MKIYHEEIDGSEGLIGGASPTLQLGFWFQELGVRFFRQEDTKRVE